MPVSDESTRASLRTIVLRTLEAAPQNIRLQTVPQTVTASSAGATTVTVGAMGTFRVTAGQTMPVY